ncbi:MAG: hypothetical protein CME71_04460 [Halobacteriovorax sp.]|nr:hypothetical protein [Halobacteriovorax sp.]|tara:strand:- start:2084 stop:2590 length:507 start_codon:yes stop_codon:yes gene_type:complete
MKTKQAFHILSVIALGLSLASCGKDNKAGNNITGVSGFSNIGNANASNQVNNLRSQRPCRFGQASVQNFTIDNGQLSQNGGFQGSGTYYVGLQNSQEYPDIVVIERVNQNRYNFQVSICPLNNGQQLQMAQIQYVGITPTVNGAAGNLDFISQYGSQERSTFAAAGTY